MIPPVDILDRGRELAADLLTPEIDEKHDAETVRLLCDEIEAHRLARDTMAPGVAERLTRYRVACRPCALTHEADPNSGVGAMRPRTADRIADDVEDMAHAMLAAEREPEVRR